MSGEGASESDEPAVAGVTALARRLISNALLYKPSRAAATAGLAPLRHDANLVPAVTYQLRCLLLGLHRDTHMALDIQGMRDEGTDVLVRLTTANAVVYVCVQVKSHKELLEKDQVDALVLQRSRSINHYGEDIFYVIFLSGDMTDKKVQARVRRVSAEFSKVRGALVVDPFYAKTFLDLSQAQMDSLVTLSMRTGDPVVADAQVELTGRHPLATALVLSLIAGSLLTEGVGLPLNRLLDDRWVEAVAARSARSQSHWTASWSSVVGSAAMSSAASSVDTAPDNDDDEDKDEDEEDDVEVFELSDLPALVLAQFLAPVDDAETKSLSNCEELVRMSLDELVEQGELVLLHSHYLAPFNQFPATHALVAEASIRHEGSAGDLIQHLVSVVLAGSSRAH